MSHVYFARGGDGLIKIGVSNNVLRRARDLRSDLLKIIPGDRDTERAMHMVFAADQAHGEWFRPSRRLVRFINSLPPLALALRFDKNGVQLWPDRTHGQRKSEVA